MKVHYINILLFSLPLNISEHNQRNHKSTTPHIPKIPTTRGLCECELYAPANYDHDPEMKKVMENFNGQTSQRFHEYDNRMVEKRKECKEQCDKEIQKIILKDKLEKELTEKFTTLETKITTHDIPTCVCKKSLADKTEKFCLNCGMNVGGGFTFSSGVLGGIGGLAVNAWKTTEIAVATQAAIAKGLAAGQAAGEAKGMAIVVHFLQELGVKALIPDISEKISNTGHYANITNFAEYIFKQKSAACSVSAASKGNGAMCKTFDTSFGLIDPITGAPKGAPDSTPIKTVLNRLVGDAKKTADAVAESTTNEVTEAAIETSKKTIEATSYNWYTTISYSITAILIIVLILVIIYLILRYRRKKKMKKKLQYIKLLEE
ncbi:rifin PIR protein, putative [Plasmodium reichenowi]|uniref:Rifin PIR protein, putative n=1 Tax=Plasmodium reichenowi TaxID=5854 RepID=A0A2P9DCH8_PLARE|nr:rifin PIR protein, putative [Plasmodium reichenowi]